MVNARRECKARNPPSLALPLVGGREYVEVEWFTSPLEKGEREHPNQIPSPLKGEG